jgi:hypothetical protein
MRIQSLVFPKRHGWTRGAAQSWSLEHGYSGGRMDETKSEWRARQEDPRAFRYFRRGDLAPSVQVVYGCPRTNAKNPAPSERVKTRRALARAVKQEQQRSERETIRAGRAAVKTARARARLTAARVRALCKTSRARASGLRAEARALGPRAREACRTRKAAAGTLGLLTVEKAKQELAQARSLARLVRETDRKLAKARAPRSSATERRQESDDAVERDIDRALVPVWRRVKRHVRGVPGLMSRTEAFLKWVEENADEVASMQFGDEQIRELEAELEREQWQQSA